MNKWLQLVNERSFKTLYMYNMTFNENKSIGFLVLFCQILNKKYTDYSKFSLPFFDHSFVKLVFQTQH